MESEMPTTTKSLTVSGTLIRCDVRDEREVDYNYTHKYSPNTEHRTKHLDCAMTTDDGRTVYFCTPRSPYRVTCVPGAAVVTYDDTVWDQDADRYVWPSDHPWFEQIGDRHVATRERANDTTLEPKIKAGDRITIRGRIKAERTSRAGNPYIVLSHVKRIVD